MGRRRVRSHWKRRRAAIKAWNIRIRNEGIRQVSKSILNIIGPLGRLEVTKDLVIGSIKVVKPEVYRKNKVLKYIDKKL